MEIIDKIKGDTMFINYPLLINNSFNIGCKVNNESN
jgi:hypothetical protein